MTTLLETIIPATSDLDRLIPSALMAGETEAAFKTRSLNNLVELIKRKPETYRAYGAWWFTLKKMVIDELGYLGFGVYTGDGETEVYRYKNDTHTLIASWLYMNERSESGALFSNNHQLDIDPSVSEEPYDYYLIDRDVENLIEYMAGLKK